MEIENKNKSTTVCITDRLHRVLLRCGMDGKQHKSMLMATEVIVISLNIRLCIVMSRHYLVLNVCLNSCLTITDTAAA